MVIFWIRFFCVGKYWKLIEQCFISSLFSMNAYNSLAYLVYKLPLTHNTELWAMCSKYFYDGRVDILIQWTVVYLETEMKIWRFVFFNVNWSIRKPLQWLQICEVREWINLNFSKPSTYDAFKCPWVRCSLNWSAFVNEYSLSLWYYWVYPCSRTDNACHRRGGYLKLLDLLCVRLQMETHHRSDLFWSSFSTKCLISRALSVWL